MGENQTWEVADEIARYLVEQGRESPNLLRSPEDLPVLRDAVETLGYTVPESKLSELMGQVNPKLCQYWVSG